MPDLEWVDVEPLPHVNGDLLPVLESADSLQRAWQEVVKANDPAFQEARRRSLRRHAIETGIIERLYEVDWGVTEALVAEGITADAVARADDGAVSEDVLALIRSQYEALQFLAESARDGRDVSVSLIRELHQALTREQKTYTATDSLGRRFEATLHHGQWKTEKNHVTRPDGSTLEYTPPEHVASQMDRLIELYHETEHAHPVVRAAWLHHRFVRIHPFEDGNGRVARCLTLLNLLRCDLAPLVVDRRERDRYLRSLDRANEGDLRPLVRFFAELEIVALRSELERPVEATSDVVAGGALSVLEAGVARFKALQSETGAQARAQQVAQLANEVHARIGTWLTEMSQRIGGLIGEISPHSIVTIQEAAPPDSRSRFWARQVVQTARSVDFFVNRHDGVWWQRLRIHALGQELRYLVFVQKVGRGETGVLALTVYAELMGDEAGEDTRQEAETVLVSTPTESVTWTYNDDVNTRWQDVTELLDTSLAAALHRFVSALG
ncbi:Fic family protein [Streptomyces filamentosus]|uniref:Fic family protein n=1 Tax=Streptomyces filamentosus TaxID=67294 RepID=UPI00332D2B6E